VLKLAQIGFAWKVVCGHSHSPGRDIIKEVVVTRYPSAVHNQIELWNCVIKYNHMIYLYNAIVSLCSRHVTFPGIRA
jgi:hypothetical protein